MVINHVLLRETRFAEVLADIEAVRSAAPRPVLLKVILETSVLSPREIIAGCKLAENAGADFVKTSTGLNGPGATVSNVELMKSVVGSNLMVKASGGIKTLKDCIAMLDAGAERIGASSGRQIGLDKRTMAPTISLMMKKPATLQGLTKMNRVSGLASLPNKFRSLSCLLKSIEP